MIMISMIGAAMIGFTKTLAMIGDHIADLLHLSCRTTFTRDACTPCRHHLQDRTTWDMDAGALNQGLFLPRNQVCRFEKNEFEIKKKIGLKFWIGKLEKILIKKFGGGRRSFSAFTEVTSVPTP